MADWFSRNNNLEEAVHHGVKPATSIWRKARSARPGACASSSSQAFQPFTGSSRICRARHPGIGQSPALQGGGFRQERQIWNRRARWWRTVKRSVEEGNLIDALAEDVAQIDSLISIYGRTGIDSKRKHIRALGPLDTKPCRRARCGGSPGRPTICA